jgi:3'(2'), 5'-bisphosphate nucleotidase
MSSLLFEVVALAKKAGEQVLNIYNGNYTIEYKADRSPITIADIAAHKLICQGLNRLTPEIPILSEELGTIDLEKYRRWRRYWLIDPLDGTKEFLERNGEFTLNIALIEEHLPVLGVVYAPAFACCYFAEKESGAFKQVAQAPPQSLQLALGKKNAPVTLIISRRHEVTSMQSFFTQFPVLNIIRCGSALKFCWVAEGFADVYPRFSPTCEWDTAAGQCILQEAGGTVIDRQGQILRYNTKSSLHNPAFWAISDRTHHRLAS